MSYSPGPPRSLLARIFISPDEPRLRAGWRLLVHSLLLLFLTLLVSIFFAPFLLSGSANGSSTLAIMQVISWIAITLSVFIARRWLDHRSLVSLGLRWDRQAVQDILVGILISGLILGLVYLFEWAAGWLRFDTFAWQVQPAGAALGSLGLWFLIFLAGAWQEELLSRGYHLQNIASGLNLAWGTVLSSLIFALLHVNNPNVSPQAILGLVAAGLFLAYGYLRTRQLWLPIGLHLGWNYFEGNIYGFRVSGLDTFHLIQQTTSGPDLLTGGAFGPEAGLIILPALVLGAALIYAYTSRDP